MDGLKTAADGPTALPVCTVRVGNKSTKVWLAAGAKTGTTAVPAPPTFEASANDLKAGIEINTAWQSFTVYSLSEVELKFGRASIEVPATPKPVMLELRFRPAGPPVKTTPL